MALPAYSWQNGDDAANGEEWVPIDDAGHEMPYPVAAEVATRFREALDDLDQFDAFCRDFEEASTRNHIAELMKHLRYRLTEVSNG